jgi:23S rRNA (guanine2445-N2)-methyltransferase / 23S rRNA (guanine2069-N7)-methyltransferase
MARNGFAEGGSHRFVRADALEWLATASLGVFDLVFLDPPTFSNSARMGERTFDVQRDHVDLLRSTVRLLAPKGTLVFSTNARRFRMDAEALPELELTDITKRTISADFARDLRIHSCWTVRKL